MSTTENNKEYENALVSTPKDNKLIQKGTEKMTEAIRKKIQYLTTTNKQTFSTINHILVSLQV